MRSHRFFSVAVTIAVSVGFCGVAPADSAKEILEACGVTGGLVVHVGCDDGKLTAKLRIDDRYLVQGLDTSGEDVAHARQHIDALGVSGNVTAARFDGSQLPYTDNLVNLLVVSDKGHLSTQEMLRVLAPGGVACVKNGATWSKKVKPRPTNIDEWTHYLHGPDNNAVAHDTVVGPPRHMQWLAGPRWTRTHHKLNSVSSVVTADGRLFYIIDEGPASNPSLPSQWKIVARDAFNGVLLWKKPLDQWANNQTRFRSGPPQVTRLLVADGDRLYAPLGVNQPVSALDAATGELLKTFDCTKGAEETVLVDGTLLVLTGSPVAEQAFGLSAFKGDYKLPNAKSIVAVDVATGKERWQWSDPKANLMPVTLATDGKQVYVQDGESVVCLDMKSGKEVWRSGTPGGKKRNRIGYAVNTLVVSDGVVLCKLAGNIVAMDAADGKKLWECKAGGGFHAPVDIFVIDGQVWQGLHTSDSVSPPPVHDFNLCRDLRTGETSRENQIMVDLQTTGHHHRCYREKATDRYIMTGKRGIEMMDLSACNHSRNNWVRGSCQYGILPANGLIYAPPHSCGCYMEAKLWGFWALAPEGQTPATANRVPDEQRLEKGPAYGKKTAANGPDKQAWPQYRGNPLRNGVAATVVPTELKQDWESKLGGRLTQPVVAGGKVLVAAIDENAVYALDEKTGKTLWKYIAGGRVDSPPAVHDGMVLFGSADGRVTCLRLDDGQLVWRFLAAPTDLRTVALDQVESLWPVHGSVLVLDGVAYCAAGRSTWLDGGIDLYGLDPATGKILCHDHFESEHPKYEQNKEGAKKEHVARIDQNTTDYKTYLAPDRSDAFSMAAGAVADVLSSDGKNVFMHHAKFSPDLKRQEKMSRHVFSTSGMLDGTENHRSHWVLGTGDFSRVPVAYSWIVNGGGRRSPTIAVPTGLMLVFDDDAVWCVRGKYSLVSRENKPFDDSEEFLPDFRRLPKEQVNKWDYSQKLPLHPRAMLKSGDHVIFGGKPTNADDKSGTLAIVSAADGKAVAQLQLPAPVVWDGMSAAGGGLFLSTADGTVRRFGPSK